MPKTTKTAKTSKTTVWKGSTKAKRPAAKKAAPAKASAKSRNVALCDAINANIAAAKAPTQLPIADIRDEAANVAAEMDRAGENAAPAAKGKARTIIVEACSRPEGATAKDLFAATTWKFASWSHQLDLAAKATGWTKEIKRVDGVTRYFLVEPTT
jgi:hypothetical protein